MSRALALSFGVVGRRWLPLGAVVVLLNWAPVTTYYLLFPAGGRGLQAVELNAAITLAFVVIGAVQSVLLTAIALERPERPPLFEAGREVARGAVTLFPFLMLVDAQVFATEWLYGAVRNPTQLMVSSNLIFIVGAALNVALAAVFGVVTPVIVAERRWPFGALSGAAALMAGARWRFVALFIGFAVLMAAPSMIGNFVVTLSFAFRGAAGPPPDYRMSGLIGALVSAPFHVFWLVVTAVSYRELTRLRDGVEAGDIEAVFA